MMSHRTLMVLVGKRQWCHDYAAGILGDFDLSSVLWISDRTPDGVKAVIGERAQKVLGQEFDAVVLDAWCGFNPDALGAVTGTICGGGALLLLTPNLDEWPHFNDPEYKKLVNKPYEISDVKGRFLRRFATLIANDKNIYLLREDRAPDIPLPVPGHKRRKTLFEATADQKRAIAAIIKVAEGRRRRPVILIADRGRGKSAALGMAAARLLEQGMRIIITAPRKSAVTTLFKHAGTLAGEAAERLVFIAPDELCRSRPQADLLLVDEAAAIPLSLLERLLKYYARVVFSTTVHGYEGTGRGFFLRFDKVLERLAPGWRTVNLQQPVRWDENDPLEKFVFHSLMLNASYAPVAKVSNANRNNCSFEKIERDELAADEELLTQLFGLLVFAHYRTRPNDLRYLLDAPGLSIYLLRHEGLIVAAALISDEGGLEPGLCQAVYEGRRRIHGHLLPQILAAHAGIAVAPELKCARVMRIAVHPALQRRGLGSRLLTEIVKVAGDSGFDYIGASFGATRQLIGFWQDSGFQPLHLGMKREHVSGSHAVVMMQPLTAKGKTLYLQGRRRFLTSLPHLLSDPLRDLEAEIAVVLMQDHENGSVYAGMNISDEELSDIKAFAFAKRGYEVTLLALWKLAVLALSDPKSSGLLDDGQRYLLVKKTLQKQQWSEVVAEIGLQGRGQAVAMLRQAVATILSEQPRQ